MIYQWMPKGNLLLLLPSYISLSHTHEIGNYHVSFWKISMDIL